MNQQQQQHVAAYSADGAANTNGPYMGTGGYAGPMNGSFYGGAYSGGYGAGGYSGAAAFGAGSMYGQTCAGSMMGGMNEEIIVTKLFSSRRDLDRLASAQDFSRRFDSNWGSYRCAGADGYGGSLSGANSAAGGSLMDLSGKPGASFMTDCGNGATGVSPDGSDSRGIAGTSARKQKVATQKAPAVEGDNTPHSLRPNDGANAGASKPKPGAEKPGSATGRNGEAPPASSQSATEASVKTDKGNNASGGVADTKPTASGPRAQQTTDAYPPSPSANGSGMVLLQVAEEHAGANAKTVSVQKAKLRAAETIDDIPLLAEDVRPKPKAPMGAMVAKKAPTEVPSKEEPTQAPAAAKTPSEALEASNAAGRVPAIDATDVSNADGKGRPSRPRSRQATRPISRLTSISVVEFPEAEEVNDEMVKDGLRDPVKEAEAAVRAEQRRERENAARAARDELQRQRQVLEEVQKQREEEAHKRRQRKDKELRQQKEMLAKLDEERKRERDAAFAARECQREEEKRRFEDMKRAVEEKEAVRAAALIAERQRQLEEQEKNAQEKTARSASRQRSRRPISRPASRLRGSIPEQPPDVVAGQMKDTLADEALGKPVHAKKEVHNSHAAEGPWAAHASSKAEPLAEERRTCGLLADAQRATLTPTEGPTEHAARSRRSQQLSPQQEAALRVEPQQKPPAVTEVVVKAQSSHRAIPAFPSSTPERQPQGSKTVRRSQAKDGKSDFSAGKSSAPRPANMVKTLVLVEEVRGSNHAVTMAGNAVSYHGQAIEVTEVKTRPEGNFNYQSSVIHDVCEAVCSGYNAAVLAVDAPNTTSRFESPVWSTLNRIVRTLLHENSNEAGELRSDFELTCAMGYLYKDKARDLLASAEAEVPFTKIGVNPSPIYGPRLTNLSYDAVTDSAAFEDVLTTTLSRASEDAALQSLTEGVLAAFVLIMQTRETDGKPDIYLSSLVVATAGADTFPYQSAISHTRNEYATVFHLVLGGPSCTCFMLNIADDDAIRKASQGEESMQEGLERALALLNSMSTLQNYDLRSGSVKRFIRYVELSHTNAQARLEKEEDEAQRRKIERYLREQERLLQDAYTMLQEASISYGGKL
ncbi:hypothetical protein LSCM4_02631 [Leishmania orientalis]|uniref:Uncharacterized protein n=1 Tax=Leishmania orientalis TaxID=2249476 RepID=A0A836GSP5_9TRYP|nr:hypothetical protein LSCM4_02631 [Leishmania orientalis]